MTVYRSTGALTGTIERESVGLAQEYLTSDDMTPYVADQSGLVGVLELVEWNLHADGHAYHVTAVSNRELTAAELKRLADAVSGQNSDGLGEGFEQQPWAEQSDCGACDGCYDGECESYGMISFDWKTNDSAFSPA